MHIFFFCHKLTIALLESLGENDPRKYFMIKFPRKNVVDVARVEPQPPDQQSYPSEPPRLLFVCLFMLRFYSPVNPIGHVELNPMGSCQAR